MKSLIISAAVAILAGGAIAQGEAPSHCSKEKAGATITQVADEAKSCSTEKKAECSTKAGAAITQVSAKVDGCSPEKMAECKAKGKECAEKAGAAITQVSAKADGCSPEKMAECKAKGKECAEKAGAAITQVSAKAEGCSPEKKASCDKGDRISFESWQSKAMPVMGYSVGEKTTTCSKTAKAMASESGSTMGYVVNGRSYESKMDALAAHTAQLNSTLESMTRVSFVVGDKDIECPMSASAACEKTDQAMRYRVGPAVFDSAEEAVRAAAMAYGMSKSVAMTYEVDGQTTTCSKSASAMSESCGKGMKFVVGGATTKCDVQADNLLASERVSKALAALEMATSQS